MSSSEDELSQAARVLCEQFGADAVLVCLKFAAADARYILTGRAQTPDDRPLAANHMLPLMFVTRRALLAIESAAAADPAWRRVLEGQRFVQAIPTGLGITEARIYRQVPVHDFVRLWFEGEPAGELILPQGTGADFLLTLGLTPHVTGAS